MRVYCYETKYDLNLTHTSRWIRSKESDYNLVGFVNNVGHLMYYPVHAQYSISAVCMI